MTSEGIAVSDYYQPNTQPPVMYVNGKSVLYPQTVASPPPPPLVLWDDLVQPSDFDGAGYVNGAEVLSRAPEGSIVVFTPGTHLTFTDPALAIPENIKGIAATPGEGMIAVVDGHAVLRVPRQL